MMLLLTNFRERETIEWPCIVQEKLDGVRCLIRNGVGYSRSGKVIGNIDHILLEIKNAKVTEKLDGELYCEEMTLSQISGMLRNTKATEKQKQMIKLYVFDIKMLGTFDKRKSKLDELKDNCTFEHIVFVKNVLVNDRQQAIDMAEAMFADRGEGIVLRNLKGLYINGRSSHVQKYKSRHDDEFKIVGYRVSDTGMLIYECITAKGFTFHVNSNTMFKELGPKGIGKLATVQYMWRDVYTDIPREAIFKCIKIEN